MGGKVELLDSLVLHGLPAEAVILPGGLEPGVHPEVPRGVHLDVPQAEAQPQAHGILPVLHGRLLDGDEGLVVPLVIEQVVSKPLHRIVEGTDGQPQAQDDDQLSHGDSDVCHKSDWYIATLRLLLENLTELAFLIVCTSLYSVITMLLCQYIICFC